MASKTVTRSIAHEAEGRMGSWLNQSERSIDNRPLVGFYWWYIEWHGHSIPEYSRKLKNHRFCIECCSTNYSNPVKREVIYCWWGHMYIYRSPLQSEDHWSLAKVNLVFLVTQSGYYSAPQMTAVKRKVINRWWGQKYIYRNPLQREDHWSLAKVNSIFLVTQYRLLLGTIVPP